MTKEQFYEKWQPNGFYQHNQIEFMTDLDSVIKHEKSHQADVSGSLPMPCKQGLIREAENRYYKETRIRKHCKEIGFIEGAQFIINKVEKGNDR